MNEFIEGSTAKERKREREKERMKQTQIATMELGHVSVGQKTLSPVCAGYDYWPQVPRAVEANAPA